MTTYTKEQYDTEAGISVFLSRGMEGFHELLKERNAAGYERKERMDQFILLGTWVIDSCGNVGLVRDMRIGSTAIESKSLGTVVMLDVLQERMPELSITWSHTGIRRIPDRKSRCLLCGHGWALETLQDAAPQVQETVTGTTFRFLHTRCKRIEVALTEQDIFKDILEEVVVAAGLDEASFFMGAIPNQYCHEKDCTSCGPWYVVATPYGNLKLGWRKRVIHLDWIDTKFDGTELFAGEDVTRGGEYIHAWGEAKLKEYLTKLFRALKEKRDDGSA
jgi:hypothetical protein